MDAARVYQVRALLFVEVLQIGDVLEVVGVKLAALDDVIGLHIVLELLDLERPALGSQDGRGLRENFGVRRWACRNGNGALLLYGIGSRLFRGNLFHIFRRALRRARSKR